MCRKGNVKVVELPIRGIDNVQNCIFHDRNVGIIRMSNSVISVTIFVLHRKEKLYIMYRALKFG